MALFHHCLLISYMYTKGFAQLWMKIKQNLGVGVVLNLYRPAGPGLSLHTNTRRSALLSTASTKPLCFIEI